MATAASSTGTEYPTRMYIDGQWSDAPGGKTLDVINPADEAVRPHRLRGERAIKERAWQHGRFWVNDPDCLVARPGFELRRQWADLIERFGGLRSASDRIVDLDDWGVRTTRRLLSGAPAPSPLDRRVVGQTP